MIDNIVKTFIIITISKFFRQKYDSYDIYYILRFFIPLIDRYSLTGELFDNKYENVKNIENFQNILLPELGIFIFELIERFYNNTLKIDTIIHHIISAVLIFINNKSYNHPYLGIHNGINIINIHNLGDIFVRIAKVIFEKNEKAGIFLGILGVVIWIYTRIYLNYKLLKNISKKLKNEKYSKLYNIFGYALYLIGIFYTFKVLNHFKKAIN